MPMTDLSFHPRDFYTLAPEIFLAAWGLVVLIADLAYHRRKSASERVERLGRLALAGAILGVFVAVLPLAIRFDLYGLQGWLNFAGIDYLGEPDPHLFLGAISSDMASETLNILLAVLFALVVWVSPTWPFTEEWGEYYALLFWSTVGMMLLGSSEDLLTLFLTLETMTICLYLLTAFEKSKRRSAEGGLKYFVYGSVSSALFLFGLSMIYGLTGSTQFSSIRNALSPESQSYSGLADNIAGTTAVLLVLVGFGFKVAAVPFHQWAPDAYEGAPAPVTSWVATGSKVASFVALLKVLLHALGPWSNGPSNVASPGWIGVVAVLAAASMTYGNFAALAQKNFKRMLAYSSIAHAGYMLVGVAAAGASLRRDAAVGAVLFYLVAYTFANIGAFALAAWLARDKGTEQIDDLGGLGFQYPALATCILLLMLSLIGLPPLAGFMGKVSMFMEALDESRNHTTRLTLLWLVALGLFNSVVSAFYYVRVLKAMFLRPAATTGAVLSSPPTSVVGSIVLATVVSLGLGIMPGPLIDWMSGVAVPMMSSAAAVGPGGLSLATPPGPASPVEPKGTMRDLMIDGRGAGNPPASSPPPAPAVSKSAQPASK